MKTYTIPIPIYHGFVQVCIKKQLGNNCSGYVERDKRDNCVYWLVLKRNKISHGSIAHEIVHLVNLIYIDRGVKLDLNNDEPQAYLTDWITSEIYRLLKQHKIKTI